MVHEGGYSCSCMLCYLGARSLQHILLRYKAAPKGRAILQDPPDFPLTVWCRTSRCSRKGFPQRPESKKAPHSMALCRHSGARLWTLSRKSSRRWGIFKSHHTKACRHSTPSSCTTLAFTIYYHYIEMFSSSSSKLSGAAEARR